MYGGFSWNMGALNRIFAPNTGSLNGDLSGNSVEKVSSTLGYHKMVDQSSQYTLGPLKMYMKMKWSYIFVRECKTGKNKDKILLVQD